MASVHVCKRDGELTGPPPAVSAVDDDGSLLWQKLAVYARESARHAGQPVHRAIVRRLRAAGLSGATTVRGIWGFRGDHVPHGGGHHGPSVTIVTDGPERISAAFSIVDEITAERGLVTVNTVTGIRTATR